MEVKQPGSHLDHMLKQTRNHHVQLSFMADSKANMLLTISSVLITLTVPHVMTSSLKYGALILIGFCLITIILSTYAVMPKLPIFTKKGGPVDIKNPGFNFLFFGDFIKMDYSSFESEMETILNDSSKTYQAMTKEIYTLGHFLAAKKYKFIRLAYTAFIVGIFTSVVVTLFTSRV
ncbi:MAG: hypothetical protein HQ528_01440 [Candidatus Marinimicrobia bacterium]|nr:hypothetical protein [Candidatus Neomarinimicrobiota bacterium]